MGRGISVEFKVNRYVNYDPKYLFRICLYKISCMLRLSIYAMDITRYRRFIFMPENDKERKEKIEKLKQERKQMEEELDELKGKTKKGKAECILAFICAMIFLLGGITLLIKTDAGGFASSSLAPVIGDVPVLRSILPKNLQRKTKQEMLAEQAATQDQTNTQNQTNAQNQASTQTQSDTQSQNVGQNSNGDMQMQDTQQSANGTDPNSTAANGANGQSDTQADTQSTEEVALQDYVKTYTSMRPKAN